MNALYGHNMCSNYKNERYDFFKILYENILHESE